MPGRKKSTEVLSATTKVIVSGLLFLPPFAWPFPENVRHGYLNCTSCHASPNGGGVLTPYGRKLSEEILTTWSVDGSGKFLGGVSTPDWLLLGGDARAVQSYRDTPTMTQKKFIFMQADVEAAASYQKLQAVATAGREETLVARPLVNEIFSRRHYLIYHYSDNFSLRAGKFLPAVGINFSDHWLLIRRNLGWDQGMESYNLEAAYAFEGGDLFVTGILGRLDRPSLQREQGGAFRSSLHLQDKHKIGLSYHYGQNDSRSRHVYGPYAILGFTEKLFALAEVDFQSVFPKTSGSNTFGAVAYTRVDYEVYRGLHPYLGAEFSQTDFSKPNTSNRGYFVGLQWFPFPHVEWNATYQWRSNEVTFAFLMLHVYL